jgi:hypothetical protein
MAKHQFKQNLYDEFDANCYKLLGVGAKRVHEVLSARGDDLYDRFEEAWDYAGAPLMRLTMSVSLAALELVYYETEIGRELTYDEMINRYESWGIGLNENTLAEYANWHIPSECKTKDLA